MHLAYILHLCAVLKKVYTKCKLEKYPRKFQHKVIDLKTELLVKIANDFELQTTVAKRSILDVSLVLSSPLTTKNQTFLTNNKRAISRFFGTVALPTQPGLHLFKVNNRNTKTLEQDVKCA